MRKKDSAPELIREKKYFTPLSYRHFRIFGWVCFALSQIAVFLRLSARFNPETQATDTAVALILSLVGELTIPLFLIANFSIILNGHRKYSNLMLTYGGLVLVACAGYYFVLEHYIIGILSLTTPDIATAHERLEMLLSIFTKNGYLVFNVFIDLFLCIAMHFFLCYRPKRHFQGKTLYLFRLFALFPFLYEVAAIALKILTNLGYATIPLFLFPFLPTKPPMMFLLFIGLIFVSKRTERKYLDEGKTYEEYREYVSTNLNSRKFSLWLMALLMICTFLDALMLVVLPLVMMIVFPAASFAASYTEAIEMVHSWGVGNSVPLLILAPFLPLYSYSRAYKKNTFDIIIPVAGISLVAFVYVEGIFQVIYEFLAKQK